MTKKHNKKPGFILILSLMLIFLCMFLVMYIANRGATFVPYATIAIERKQAYVLAQSGAELAISQIITPKVEKKAQKGSAPEANKKKKPTEEDKVKDMLTVVLPNLNRWQVVTLTEAVEGIDATIKFCIMCENGKFNLNALYNFQDKKFIDIATKDDTQKGCKTIFEAVKKANKGKDLLSVFEVQLKKRDIRFNDATELMTQAFEPFKGAVFYEPPVKDGPKSRPLYLMDIFTVWTQSAQINPWLMSDSVGAIFGLKPSQAQDEAERKKGVAQWLKPFKLKAQWKTDWNTQLKPLYGKDYNSIPKSLQPFLSGTFEATVFSILSYATVGRVTQRLLTIVERTPAKGDEPEDVTIKKVYWL